MTMFLAMASAFLFVRMVIEFTKLITDYEDAKALRQRIIERMAQ